MIREALLLKVNAMTSNRKEQARFFKFAVVGAMGAVVDFFILNLLVQLVGFPPLLANPFSFSAAVISNFTWNRLWSFPESRERALLPQFMQFASINLVGLLINQTIMWIMLHYILRLFYISPPLDYNLAKAVAIGIVLFWNFGINRITTYRGL